MTNKFNSVIVCILILFSGQLFAEVGSFSDQDPELKSLYLHDVQLLEKMRNAPPGADVSGLNQQIQALDSKILERNKQALATTTSSIENASEQNIATKKREAIPLLQRQWNDLDKLKAEVLQISGRKYNKGLEGHIKRLEDLGSEYNKEAIRKKVEGLKSFLNDKPIKMSGADCEKIRGVACNSHASPSAVMDTFKKIEAAQDPGQHGDQAHRPLTTWFDGWSGTEMGSIYNHQKVVVDRYNSLKNQFDLPRFIDGNLSTDEFMRIYLSLHDTGKSLSVEKGLFGKAAQHDFIGPVVDSTLRGLGFNADEISLAKALVEDETLGDFLLGKKSIDEAKKSLEENYKTLTPKMQKSISLTDYTKYVSAFYHCDSGAYQNLVNIVYGGGETKDGKIVGLKVSNGKYSQLMKEMGVDYDGNYKKGLAQNLKNSTESADCIPSTASCDNINGTMSGPATRSAPGVHVQ